MKTLLNATSAGVVLALMVAGVLLSLPGAARAEDDDRWPLLKSDFFAGKTIIEEDARGPVVEAPYRADDAAIVPITVKIPGSLGTPKTLTLIVEKNPAPMAAQFTFGPAAGGDVMIATRLRFDLYSNLRAIMETTDGKLYMTTKFVKAAGGCSAPALKDADEAMANLGRTQVRVLGDEPGSGLKLGQVMVRHPNYSGMQMDQTTGLYIPPHYVTDMEVTRGGERVFKLEAGISISADPNIRFSFAPAADNQLAVSITDSDGKAFKAQSVASGS